MAMMAKANTLEAPVLEILDLEALDGEVEAIPTLMNGLIAAARQMGTAKVRLQRSVRASTNVWAISPEARGARAAGGIATRGSRRTAPGRRSGRRRPMTATTPSA